MILKFISFRFQLSIEYQHRRSDASERTGLPMTVNKYLSSNIRKYVMLVIVSMYILIQPTY